MKRTSYISQIMLQSEMFLQNIYPNRGVFSTCYSSDAAKCLLVSLQNSK